MTDNIRIVVFGSEPEAREKQEEETPVVVHKHPYGASAKIKANSFHQEKCSCHGNPGKCKHECRCEDKKQGYASPNNGVKYDSGKPRVDLLPFDALMEIGRVFGYGGKKYEDNNWAHGMNHSRMMGAALRHLFAYWNGEDNDPESGFSHLACAGCNVLMLLASRMRKCGVDDRFAVETRNEPQVESEEEKGTPENESHAENTENSEGKKAKQAQELRDLVKPLYEILQ